MLKDEMNARLKVPVVNLYCNPDMLRKLADRMEKKVEKIKLADSTFIEYIYGTNVCIAVHLKQ